MLRIWLKKTTLIISMLITLTLVLAPTAQASRTIEIIAGGIIEYSYLQNSLKKFHYKQNDKVLATYKKQYGVNAEELANEQLDRVMKNLIEAVRQHEKIDPEYSWFVNKQESFNAFCAIGNVVSANIGLFKFLNYNEDHLAFVLAHEIAHGQRQHVLKSVRRTVPVSVAQSLYMSKNPTYSSYILSSIAVNMTVARHTTLPMEKEADKFSYDYAVAAGYNPGAGAAIWSRVVSKYGDKPGSVFEKVLNPSTHPTNSQRVTYFAECMTEHSKKMVKVENKIIYVKDENWTSPVAAYEQIAEERTYLIAGNLAAVFNSNAKGSHAYVKDGSIKMADKLIMTPAEGDLSAEELAARLNKILGF
jgi:predicted Zn-dependent protease